MRGRLHVHRRYLYLATLILLLGAGLRLAELHHFPPGLHYDEAADMLLGRDIAFFGYNPFPVVTAYSGREALFYYLSVPLLHIIGGQVLATRLTSAFLGILTIAVTIALGKSLLRADRAQWAVGLLAGAWLAVNGAQVWLTRQGFRTSPQPLLEALCLWLLVVGLRRVHRWQVPLFLGGVCGGLSLYVYMAARIFPLWLVLPLIFLIGIERSGRGLRLRQIFWFGLGLVIASGPIVDFYAAHPDVFLDRLSQLTPGAQTPPVSLLESLSLHAQMFFLRGDPTLRYNLYPGRPFFDLISGGLLILGWAAALYAALQRRNTPLIRFGGALAALSPLLIFPSLIATAGLPPSHMRSVAMVPLIFFLPAGGLLSLSKAIPVVRGMRVSLKTLIAGALILLLGLHTWIDYRAWGMRPDLFYQANGDYLLAARWLEQNAHPDDLIFFASEYYEHPTVLAHQIESERLRWMMAEQLFWPPPDREALIIIPRAILDAGWRWGDQLPDAARLPDMPHGPDGEPAFAAYRIKTGDVPGVSSPTGSNFGGVLRLDSAAIRLSDTAPNSLQARLWWSVSRTPERADLTPILTVIDPWGNEIARFSPYLEQAARWLPGERIGFDLILPLPPGTPPGSYQVQSAWVSRADAGYYLPLLNDQGAFAGLWADVAPPVDFHPTPEARFLIPDQAVALGSNLWLQSGPIPAQLEQGDTLHLSLDWYALNAPGDQGPISLKLESPDKAVLLWQGSPVGDTYPFARWTERAYIRDRYQLALDAGLTPGSYRLTLSLQGQTLVLGETEIIEVERVLIPPSDLAVEPFDFGDQIRLAGWHFSQTGPGEVTITLIWQALTVPDQDYTVFVHVVNDEGLIQFQQDKQPPRPTRRWIEGEFVRDQYTLKVPTEGAYSFRIGLYLQANGLRLPVKDFRGRESGDFAPFPAFD